MLKAIFGITALTLAFTASSYAVDTPKIDSRQTKQEQRIDEGVKSGALTQKEEAKLDAGQAKIQKMEDKAKADDNVTRQERKRINHRQDVESRKIHRMKHNENH